MIDVLTPHSPYYNQGKMCYWFGGDLSDVEGSGHQGYKRDEWILGWSEAEQINKGEQNERATL